MNEDYNDKKLRRSFVQQLRERARWKYSIEELETMMEDCRTESVNNKGVTLPTISRRTSTSTLRSNRSHKTLTNFQMCTTMVLQRHGRAQQDAIP
eukprot:2421487-Amphidinium_carterae.1